MTKIDIEENVILIRINKLYHDAISVDELYEVTRGIWRVGIRREKAEYAFSIYKGIVKEVFIIESWHPACTTPYKLRSMIEAISNVEKSGRWEFKGKLAEEKIRNKYIGKSFKEYFKFGASNPIIYINC